MKTRYTVALAMLAGVGIGGAPSKGFMLRLSHPFTLSSRLAK